MFFFFRDDFATQASIRVIIIGPKSGIVCQSGGRGRKKMEEGDNSLTRRDTRWKFIWQFDVATRWEQYRAHPSPPIGMILMIVPRIDNGFIIDRWLCCGNSPTIGRLEKGKGGEGVGRGGGRGGGGGESWRTPKAETRSLK